MKNNTADIYFILDGSQYGYSQYYNVKLLDVLSNVSLISILIYIIIELLMFNLK